MGREEGVRERRPPSSLWYPRIPVAVDVRPLVWWLVHVNEGWHTRATLTFDDGMVDGSTPMVWYGMVWYGRGL